jgi:pimeloyl-ACP methyl ester carboxylesterase
MAFSLSLTPRPDPELGPSQGAVARSPGANLLRVQRELATRGIARAARLIMEPRTDGTGRAPASTTADGTAAPGHPSACHVAAVERLRLSDGRALCVRWWPGKAEGTLVLLHGMLDSSEGWTRLSEGFTCRRIAFDLPGFGYSDSPARGSILGYAQDIAEGLRMLGVTRFTVVGHSLGGAVAVALAELMPDSVCGLVLLAPVGFGRIHIAEAVSLPGVSDLAAAALRMTLSSRLAVSAAYATIVTNGKLPDPELVDRLTSRGGSLIDGTRQATRALAEAGRAPDAFHRRHVRYTGPVYSVWGDQDRLVPVSHIEGVRAALPQARIDVWRGMGHHPARERTQDLIDVVAGAVTGRARQQLSSEQPQADAA